MPWKNGLGFTDEIAIGPEDAKFPIDPFNWRLSTATVSDPGPFSVFQHCDRWLTVVEGNGLTLNDQTTVRYGECARISGETPTHCEPIDGSVIDFGLIFDRRACDAEMNFVTTEKGTLILDFGVASSCFLFLCRGKLCFESTTVHEGETVVYEHTSNAEIAEIDCLEKSEFVLVKIYRD
jgi:environmental stress-induced protein Ves